MKNKLIPLLLAATCTCAFATHYEADTEDAHIIVTRPIDMWSGDQSTLEKSLDALKEKVATYKIWRSTGGYEFGNSSTLLFQNNTKELAQAINAKLAEKGFKATASGLNSGRIDKATPIAPTDLPALFTIEQEAFKRSVISNGDPTTLQDRTSTKKALGTVLAVATIAVAADKVGLEAGTHMTLGSGIADDVRRVTYSYKGPVTPVAIQPEKIDFNAFKEAEIRQVITTRPDLVGQVIILYKGAKTPQAEQAALVEATTLLFAGTSPEEAEKNRAADFEARKAIWTACVASGECK